MAPEATTVDESDSAVLLATAAEGVYLQSEAFERLTAAIQRSFTGLLGRAPDLAVRGGAVIAVEDLRRSAYVDRFPQLVATVTPHLGDHGAGCSHTAMTPAACLNLYPLIAARGPIPGGGVAVAITAPCHRTEAHYGPTRLRTFTMSELVFFGRAAQVGAFVDHLRAAIERWLIGLGLTPLERAANDPFYGRGAEVMAQHQRALQTKIEVTLPIGDQSEVACLSINLHGEFFSQRWEIALAEGGWAQSACVGVGLERLAAALIERHGERLNAWPPAVRTALFEAAS